MRNEKIRNYIADVCEGAIIFDSPDFDNSIVGITSDNQVVYDFDLMVEEFKNDNNCTEEEASDFINYDTLRSIPYLDINRRPLVIINKLIEED